MHTGSPWSCLHISDLHLHVDEHHDPLVIEALLRALHAIKAARGSMDALFLTGDLFDSSAVNIHDARDLFLALIAKLRGVYPGIPIVVTPGNHDRRDSGVIGPHNPRLFEQLACNPPSGVTVCGNAAPLLATVLPEASHGFHGPVVAYDSTVLPRGKFSAGGNLRSDDLLQAASIIDRDHGRDGETCDCDESCDHRCLPDCDCDCHAPMLLLLHHHLVPTPVTDVGMIDLAGKSLPIRVLVSEVLPRLVANGDREELTMTALGAGTALTTLHAFGRPVVVLHGHKHYPTVRLLKGTRADEGDVLLLSAGSAGVRERWSASQSAHGMRLWPSLNVLRIDGGRLEADIVLFRQAEAADILPAGLGGPDVATPTAKTSTKAKKKSEVVTRHLATVERRGRTWTVIPSPAALPISDKHLESNRAAYTLIPSKADPLNTFDVVCRRELVGFDLDEYEEELVGLPKARLVTGSGDHQVERPLPPYLRLATSRTTEYRLEEAVCRSCTHAARVYAPGTAFEWVGLINRYGAGEARLEVRGLPDPAAAFASITDLTTGKETPARLSHVGDAAVLEQRPCEARTLLRVYWQLASDGGAS